MSRPDFPWQLPEAIQRRLGRDSYGAQRSIHEQGYLLLILHEPPASASAARQHAVFLRTPEAQWSFQGHPNGEQALQGLLDRYQTQLDQGLKAYDLADQAAACFALIERVRPVARAAGNLHAALQAAREAVKDDSGLITARDRGLELARSLDLLLADAQLALNFQLARQAEAQTQAALASQRAQEKLNTIAAWTFPVITLASLFGMNLHSGLESVRWVVFWPVLAAGLVLGWWAKAWVLKTPPAPAAAAAGQRKTGSATRRPSSR